MAEETTDQLKARLQRLEEENRKWMRLAGINRLYQAKASGGDYVVGAPKTNRMS